MNYDINVLKTREDCRLVMNRAKVSDRGLYDRAFRRLCDLEAQKYADPLEGAFWSAVEAYEQMLTEKNGRTTKATRVRGKINRLGKGIETITLMLEEWALAPVKVGFANLLEAGMPEHMAEYIVAYRFPTRFTKEAVASAKKKLDRCGIAPPL